MESGVMTSGARFMDAEGRDRGWATKVTKRVNPLSGLTVLDVTTMDAGLAGFLRTLDRDRVTVEHTDELSDSYTFSWASGYEDGGRIRVQGTLATGMVSARARRGPA